MSKKLEAAMRVSRIVNVKKALQNVHLVQMRMGRLELMLLYLLVLLRAVIQIIAYAQVIKIIRQFLQVE